MPGRDQLPTTGFALNSGESNTSPFLLPGLGRLWGRTSMLLRPDHGQVHHGLTGDQDHLRSNAPVRGCPASDFSRIHAERGWRARFL
ncbi:hypothetical protein GBA52_025696 [Prunus armeniaca]|nr:hypothetical protein GBA52_025696 [Prunus armeniaca]